MQKSASETLTSLAASLNNKKCIVFCGAGISLHSGIPLATDFRNRILQALNEALTLMPLPPLEKLRQATYLRMPFEAFFQILYLASDPSSLLTIFQPEAPNVNHEFLAQICARGLSEKIATTNFDLLIETALEKNGLTRHKDFLIWTPETKNQIDGKFGGTILYKLHGTIDDIDGIAITLERVAKRQMRDDLEGVLRLLFESGNHEDVLVLGYSCSDWFDISPELKVIKNSSKRVLVVQHTSGVAPEAGSIEIIRGEESPFSYFQNALQWFCDTDMLISDLWQKVLRDPLPRGEHKDNRSWQRAVDDWLAHNLKERSPAFPYSVLGGVLSEASDYEGALQCWQKGFEIAEQHGSRQSMASFLGNMGIGFERLGDYERARQCVIKSIQISEEIGDLHGILAHSETLMGLDFHLGLYEDATKRGERVVALARASHEMRSEVTATINLAMAYRSLGQMEKAGRYAETAIEVSKENGLKSHEAYALQVAGSVKMSLELLNESIDLYDKALHISQIIADKELEGSILGNLGTVFRKAGMLRFAVDHQLRALEIAREMKNPKSEGVRLAGLARAYLSLGEYGKAIENFKEALAIARRIGDREGEGSRLADLGTVYQECWNFRLAVKCFEVALTTLDEVLGPAHSTTLSVRANLARAQELQKLSGD